MSAPRTNPSSAGTAPSFASAATFSPAATSGGIVSVCATPSGRMKACVRTICSRRSATFGAAICTRKPAEECATSVTGSFVASFRSATAVSIAAT